MPVLATHDFYIIIFTAKFDKFIKFPYISNLKTFINFKPMLLKEILQSKGLKQKWLAGTMGVSEVTVSNWCSGKSVPTNSSFRN